MPWYVEHDIEGSGWTVVRDSTDKIVGYHKTKSDAEAQLAALHIAYAAQRHGELAPSIVYSNWGVKK